MDQLIPRSFFDFSGVVGVAIAVGAFALLQAGLIRGQSYAYAGLNLLSAALVLISLTETFNLSSAIKQVIWICISLFGITRIFLLNRYLRFSDEEQSLLQATLPGLGKASARRLFKSGEWRDVAPGDTLITEQTPVEELVYLGHGLFDISLNGVSIATSRPGSFVGELSWQNNSPATATVIVAQPSRIFAIKAQALRQLTVTDGELRHALELGFSRDTKSKLLAANESLSSAGAGARAGS